MFMVDSYTLYSVILVTVLLFNCIIVTLCPELTDPTHGSVLPPDELTVGSVATYVCETGYKLCERCVNSRTCQQDASWSDQMPVCQGMYPCPTNP